MNEQLRNALPHQDTPFFRMLHIIVAVLVLLQIVNSNLTEREALSSLSLTGIVTWFHIISGLALIVLGVIMLGWMLKQRGFRYYFAWLALDFKGVIEDINVLFSFRLPDAHAGGIAALIQGLGVLSLLGVAMCGGLWFVLNTLYGPSSALTESMLHFHKFLTVFIEAYFWAHGAMGLIHIFLIVRSQRKNSVNG
ncbi:MULTISPECIES: cytochrome b/b6 domain-containing protein [Enterobacter]|uniref:cytochrome b/b6 domain-containing protein n=1 Tax=Enterobacter TaxID=547 RepID=UPI0028EFBA76|nr:cytochrome b/b6 domain-containing protein [Enterobacter cloacae]HDR2751810.1 cytochrome b/b6 domain-containing protein [Enterobacter asburiae]WNT38778.1 cytochrome b/b6 domain-containing protein [Enterobacter cloacae]HDR2787791.1 cytochrome b/b6 domain-containing protein [Enterobacter asburiae]HDR2795986.1 cytochrome b/b6 domain-containing protein [Enterobacter asburiae]HDR2801409.1 cytochrome b/b6 domain-containing protein [Enterobacter asburiae]